MNDLGLVANQTKYELRSYFRNKPALIFTFSFPVMFLLVFGLVGRNTEVNDGSYIDFFVPGMLTFAVLSACYTGLAMKIPLLRDAGILKRIQGTPLPGWAYLCANIATSIIVAAILSSIILLLSTLLLGAELHSGGLVSAAIALTLGAATLCALGLALASTIPNGESAAPTVQMSVWPVVFVSNIFYPLDDAPKWLQSIGDVLPLKHIANGVRPLFDASVSADFSGLMILAAWAALAAVVAARSFRWEPAPRKRRRHT